ncbi:IclR family transcriptional regulator [Aquibacillus sediminis]|uniref:IclR family transcriptional regulator n=1 Tax=Aquibacillus sediminis TaxID=2574734 RepID=UPI001108E2E3|nr:IclR family transcriptional regulator [Aquibacillus sediminis]
MEKNKAKTTIKSLEVGLNIIDMIVHHKKPLTFTEIVDLTGITKSNLFKYLNTLTNNAVLSRDSRGLYTLGPKLIDYGIAAIGSEDVLSKVTPAMEEMNEEIDETVLFSIFSNIGPIVVHIVKSSQTINIGAEIGTELPLHSSSGKIFAAYQDTLKVKKWVELEKTKLDTETINSLQEEISKVKKQGIAHSYEALAPAVSSYSIPILNFKHDLLGAITVVSFNKKKESESVVDLKDYLLEKSVTISRAFGYG